MTPIISILLMKQLRLKQTCLPILEDQGQHVAWGRGEKGEREKGEGEAGHLKGNGDTVLYI